MDVIVYLIFSYSKTAEQNRVWVGLAKETAHQLGTPISSLMAWMEYFKEDPAIKNKGVVEEIDKDIKKLQLITERFSNIGSVPVLKEEKLEEIVKFHERIKDKAEVIKGLEKTFYGATEFSIQDINGYILTFAEDEK